MVDQTLNATKVHPVQVHTLPSCLMREQATERFRSWSVFRVVTPCLTTPPGGVTRVSTAANHDCILKGWNAVAKPKAYRGFSGQQIVAANEQH